MNNKDRILIPFSVSLVIKTILANGGVDYEANEDLLILDPRIMSVVGGFESQITEGIITIPDAIYWT
jgi:hypothetical protein